MTLQQIGIAICVVLLVLADAWMARIALRSIRTCERLRSERDLLAIQVGVLQISVNAAENAERRARS